MNKKELISRVSETLREHDVRKRIGIKKSTFHITDDEGNSANFHVKRSDKEVIYTTEDVGNIIDACLLVIFDAIRHGEEITIKGFGSLGVHHRAARRTKIPQTDQWCEVRARCVPKFYYGADLRKAALLYEASMSDHTELNLEGYEDEEDFLEDLDELEEEFEAALQEEGGEE